MKFKIGDKVKLNKTSRYYHQSKGHEGKIISSEDEEGWYRIKWSHGAENTYPKDHIIRVGKKGEKPKAVNFLLVDGGASEEFSSMKEVEARIAELVKEDSSVDCDSLIVYQIKAKHTVEVKTSVSLKAA